MIVWDYGTWEPEVADVDDALRRGELKFTLHGKKLRGGWVLVRTARGWLLIKHRDAYASKEDILKTQPHSVLSR